jgi:hypothetical protein
VAGFLAIAAFVVFEIGTIVVFWVRHSLSDSSGERFPGVPRTTRFRRLGRH